MASELRVDKIIPVDGVPSSGGGGIVQIVKGGSNTRLNRGNNTGTYYNTYVNATITPKFNTSKILITLNLLLEVRSASIVAIELTRGGSSIFTNEGGLRANESANGGYLTFSYLDSPASTSALTYGVQTRSSNGDYTFNNYIGGGPANSFMTLMEVSA